MLHGRAVRPPSPGAVLVQAPDVPRVAAIVRDGTFLGVIAEREEAAVAAHLPQMDLAGVCVTSDAAHTVKANARQLTQGNGADYLMILKGNQPHALAKARQLSGAFFPPSGPDDGQGPRTH